MKAEGGGTKQTLHPSSFPMRVLGIDPGTATLGYGMIDADEDGCDW